MNRSSSIVLTVGIAVLFLVSGVSSLSIRPGTDQQPSPSKGVEPSSLSGLQVAVLASFSAVVGANDQTFTLNLTVPAGTSEVLVLWAIGGGLAAFNPPSLPTGLSVTANATDPYDIAYAGVAAGALAPGNYSTSLTYPGWTNDVSLAAYGVLDASGATYRFASSTLNNTQPGIRLIWGSVSLPSRAVEYIGALATGGYPVYNLTMSSVTTEAPGWDYIPGYTEVIGSQDTPVIEAATPAHTLDVVGVGIYSQPTPDSGPPGTPGRVVALFAEPYVLGPLCAILGGGAVVLLLRPHRSAPTPRTMAQPAGPPAPSREDFHLPGR